MWCSVSYLLVRALDHESAASRVKHGIRRHSAEFSLSPFDGTRSGSHTSSLAQACTRLAGARTQTSRPYQGCWKGPRTESQMNELETFLWKPKS